MSFRPKSVYKGMPQPPPVLNLTLSHGDVVIMAGRAIQYHFDHRVIPTGLRVAATARVIRGASPG
jgi:alkylated DNA repair dioxygenase AlkB